MKTSEIITYCYLRSQRIELLCGSADYGFGGFQLSLTNGMHDFNAGNRTACGPKGFEAEHGTSDSFYRHAPAASHGALPAAELFLKLRGILDDPPIEGGMIH